MAFKASVFGRLFEDRGFARAGNIPDIELFDGIYLEDNGIGKLRSCMAVSTHHFVMS